MIRGTIDDAVLNGTWDKPLRYREFDARAVDLVQVVHDLFVKYLVDDKQRRQLEIWNGLDRGHEGIADRRRADRDILRPQTGPPEQSRQMPSQVEQRL
jgi:hypothetical protein